MSKYLVVLLIGVLTRLALGGELDVPICRDGKGIVVGEYQGMKVYYDGEISLWVLKNSICESEHPQWKSAFPSYVDKNAYPYQVIAFAVYENDPNRLREGCKILEFIAEADPQTLVPNGVDWPENFKFSCAMATMPYTQKLIPPPDPKRFPTQNIAPPPGFPDIYYGRFDGVFPGFRHLTYGKFAKEALERIKKRMKGMNAIPSTPTTSP